MGQAMEALTAFVAMGGYGGYVWSAYGLAAAVLAGLWLAARRRKRRALRRIK